MCGHGRHHRGHGCGCPCGHGDGGCHCSCGQDEGCDCEEGHHGHGSRHGHARYGAFQGSGPGRGFRRRFISRAERIAELEAYLSDLRAEATAVEEHLAELRAGG